MCARCMPRREGRASSISTVLHVLRLVLGSMVLAGPKHTGHTRAEGPCL